MSLDHHVDSSYQVLKIYSLTGEQLVEFLKENGLSSEVCQIFTDQDFDGGGFMELTEADLKELFPSKMGTVKKLIRIQRTGSIVPNVQLPSTGELKNRHLTGKVLTATDFFHIQPKQIIIDEKKKSGSADRDSISSKKPRTENVTTVDKPTVGCYVTLKCQKYRQFVPQIGLVESINDSEVTVDWLEGTFTGTWNFWKYKGKPVRETFPRRAVIKTVQLTAGMRLRSCDANSIKDDYLDIEYV